jgi:Protein of unknown function (DUF3108)
MFLLRFFISLLMTAAAHAATPTGVSISYNLFRNGTHIGVVNETFEIRDSHYRATSEASAIGLFALAQRRPITYVSTGEFDAKDGLRPLKFEGRRGNSASVAQFDWKSHKLHLTVDGHPVAHDLPHATQDRLSAMYQFMHRVAAKPRVIEFAMTNGRKIDLYRYDVTPDVAVDTPLKRVNTLHLVKQREEGDSRAEVWLAPEFHHLPVKVLVIDDDGVRYEQVVTKVAVKP